MIKWLFLGRSPDEWKSETLERLSNKHLISIMQSGKMSMRSGSTAATIVLERLEERIKKLEEEFMLRKEK